MIDIECFSDQKINEPINGKIWIMAKRLQNKIEIITGAGCGGP
jgi:hypothetical protein